ncbi:MAG: hypothetical protein HUU57_16880 [Bdellovibrio sp.]|nr:hypothetical protein [Bdellovibrio sp.]
MNLKSFVGAILACVLLASCSEKKSTATVEFIGGSPDAFAITVADAPPPEEWVHPTDCRAHIAQIICEVKPQEGWGNPLERTCLGGEQKYQKSFEDIYDALDPINQKMFCSLRRIFIEQEFYATGYASLLRFMKDGQVTALPGAIMGVRKSVLEANPSLPQWASWKEQLNFVAIPEEFTTPLPYPRFDGQKPPSLLLDIVVHEFGHMLDFANSINEELFGVKDCMQQDIKSEEDYFEKCKPYAKPGSWTDISWIDGRTAKPEKDFLGRSKLCFYNCVNRMDLQTEMVPFYQGLAQSDFVTSYAASNYMDDFAEAWAVRWMLTTLKGDLSIKASPTVEVQMQDIFESQKFKVKKEYMDKFVQGEIKYP